MGANDAPRRGHDDFEANLAESNAEQGREFNPDTDIQFEDGSWRPLRHPGEREEWQAATERSRQQVASRRAGPEIEKALQRKAAVRAALETILEGE